MLEQIPVDVDVRFWLIFGAAFTLAVLALCALPARQAAKIDPNDALRG